HRRAGRDRRARGDHGPLGLRQVDPPVYARLPGPPRQRLVLAGRPRGGPPERRGADPDPAPSHRLRLPVVPPRAAPDRGGERGAAHGLRRPAARRAAAAGRGRPGGGGPLGSDRPPAGPALRRRAPAGGPGPRHGDAAAPAPGRRAHGQPRHGLRPPDPGPSGPDERGGDHAGGRHPRSDGGPAGGPGDRPGGRPHRPPAARPRGPRDRQSLRARGAGRMTLTDLFRFALGSLGGHRLRTALSLVGMAIGVAAVVALTALGEGARRYVIDQFASIGTNLLIVVPGKTETTGIPGVAGGTANDITLEDAEAVARQIPEVDKVAPIV